MVTAEQKKKRRADRNLSRYIFLILISTPVVLTLMILPWVLLRSQDWTLDQKLALLPLSSSLFELPFQILGNQRLILPEWSLPLLLIGLTLLAPLSLILLHLLARRLVRHSPLFSFTTSLMILLVAYPYGFPGISPEPLYLWIVALFFIWPVIHTTSWLGLWSLATLGIAISIPFPALQGQIFWTAFSLGLARSLHFLIVEKLRLKRSERTHLWLKTFQVAGTISLMVFAFWSLKVFPLKHQYLGPGQLWYLSFAGGVLALGLTFISPWQSLRWMTIATFCQGILFFKTMQIPVIIAVIYLSLTLLYELFNRIEKSMPILFSGGLRYSYVLLTLALSFGLFLRTSKEVQIVRDFDPEWIGTLSQLSPEESSGVFVIGRGLSFLSHFRHSEFLYDPELLFEPSEDKWVRYLEANQIKTLVIEVPEIKSIWAQWIKSGNRPDRINKSVLARLVSYQGNEVQSSTLKLEKLKKFKVEETPELENILIVRLPSRT